MRFFLDSLFISLVILTIYLVVRLVRQQLKYRQSKRPQYAYLHPTAENDQQDGRFRIRYDIPQQTPVLIEVLDNKETLLCELVNQVHEAGSHSAYYDRPADLKEFIIRFSTNNLTTTKRVSL